jgi:diguanylate cyclase (GGDEF)-like protein
VEKQVHLHGFLGLAFTSLCSFHESLEHHMMALSLCESLCESLGQDFDTATAFINIGWAYCQMADYPKAQDYFSRALVIAQSHDHALLRIRALGNLANVYGHLGDHQTAIDCYERVADISQAIGHHKFLSTSTGNIAISFAALGRLDQAMTFFDLALAQLESVPNNSHQGWLHVQMGKALRESNPDLARDHLEYGLQKLHQAGSFEDVAETHLMLSGLYEASDFARALEHHKAFAALEIKQLKDINEKRTQALTVQFEVAHLQRERQTDQLKNLELARINERLEELSLRDALTGLHNRRYLDAQLGKLHLEAQGAAQPFAVLISDIDNFKQVNDSFSHLIGDQVLKTVAQLLVNQVRASDLVVRYGGEEFVLVVTQVTLEQALMVAEKLRATVESYPWHELHPDLRITLSIGICADMTLEHHERMLAVADDKMYVAKRNGKNQVRA